MSRVVQRVTNFSLKALPARAFDYLTLRATRSTLRGNKNERTEEREREKSGQALHRRCDRFHLEECQTVRLLTHVLRENAFYSIDLLPRKVIPIIAPSDVARFNCRRFRCT